MLLLGDNLGILNKIKTAVYIAGLLAFSMFTAFYLLSHNRSSMGFFWEQD